MAVCCQNLTLGKLSSRSALSLLVGAQFKKFFLRRAACARAQFSGSGSTTNAYSETGRMAVCSQNLMLGTLSSHSTLSVLVGALLKRSFSFLNTVVYTFKITE
jgi:5-formaminoimidazole-4-carboxamide-1-beta-D-ribofuranosyl 5'-monophosphate synthetase